MTTRYTGKPLLRLVDAYILDAIGHLPPEVDAALTEREPGYRERFGATGSWRDIVAAQMRFPAGLPGAVREVWDKGRVKFVAEQGYEPDPGQFTRSFVDSKFPH